MPSPSDIIRFLIQFFDSGWFLVLQITGGAISFVLLIAIIWLIKAAGYPQRHWRHLWIAWNAGKVPKDKFVSKWISVESVLKTSDPGNWRGAIIQADKILDELMTRMGYHGRNLEERLANVNPRLYPEQFPSMAEAYKAHQVRAFIEEDPNYMVSREVAEKTIGIYRNIFKETGVLDF